MIHLQTMKNSPLSRVCKVLSRSLIRWMYRETGTQFLFSKRQIGIAWNPLLSQGASFLSPVRRVPSELLGSIMDLSTYHVSSNHALGPWRFTRVSRFWRQTAIGLPSLWTNIQLNISTICTKRTYQGLADLNTEILARSTTLPLSVFLSLEGENEVSLRVLDLLVAESYRWGSFPISLNSHEHFLRLLPTMRSLTPGLESSHVISLSLEMACKRTVETVQLHLPNLLRLEASDSIYAIGGKFPELRELFLHEDIDWRKSHIINNILSTSAKLQTLSEWGHLTSFYNDHLFRILNAVPSLEVLRLYPRGRPSNQNKDAIFSLIARLTLRPVGIPNQTSFPVLPRLTHLLLHLPKKLAYSVRLISGSEMESEIKSRASNLAVSPDFGNSRLRRIWIQDGGCSAGVSKLEKLRRKIYGVEVCIARPLVLVFGCEVGLVTLSSSGEITSESVLRNYL